MNQIEIKNVSDIHKKLEKSAKMGCVERVQKNVENSENNTILFLNILANLVLNYIVYHSHELIL